MTARFKLAGIGGWVACQRNGPVIKRRTRAALENRGYVDLGGDACGRFKLAGQSVAVPFVGAAAATFVLAEVLRMYRDGPAYSDLKPRLATPGELIAVSAGRYTVEDVATLDFAPAR